MKVMRFLCLYSLWSFSFMGNMWAIFFRNYIFTKVNAHISFVCDNRANILNYIL